MDTTTRERMTGGTAIVRSLIAQGTDTLFGLPGVQLDGLFNALYDHRNQLRTINARHEQGVAYMAYGYAYSTGRPGVFAVVPGPGILNAAAGLATAYGSNQPVLAITGQIPSATIGRGLGMLHEIPDQLGIMRSLSKWAERIEHPTTAPGLVNEAFRQLRTGRPRPAALEMAMDMLALESEVAMPGHISPEAAAEPDSDLIAKAAKLLGQAKTPLICVGGGAFEAAPEILALAEMLQAPVTAFQHGRGIVDDRHYLMANSVSANRLWPEADVVLGIGSRLQNERMVWGGDKVVIHVEIDPSELTRVRKPTVGIVADAALAARALLDAIPAHNSKRPSREAELLALKGAAQALIDDKLALQSAYLKAIRAALPEDGFFVDELTQVGYVSRLGLPVYHPRTYITPGYQGTLGYGFATSLGVKVAHPDKAVVSINGDGGFMYGMPELSTAVNHGINVVAVVFADGAFGNVQRMQKELYDGRVIATDLRNPDFVKLAESFGATGYQVDTPDALRDCITRALGEPGPTLIEVPVGEFPEPWPILRPGPWKP